MTIRIEFYAVAQPRRGCWSEQNKWAQYFWWLNLNAGIRIEHWFTHTDMSLGEDSPYYWPLIGRDRSRDLNTGLWLVRRGWGQLYLLSPSLLLLPPSFTLISPSPDNSLCVGNGNENMFVCVRFEREVCVFVLFKSSSIIKAEYCPLIGWRQVTWSDYWPLIGSGPGSK